MKPAEIRELSDDQLVEKLKEGRAELFNLRFQMATSQLDNTARVKHREEGYCTYPHGACAPVRLQLEKSRCRKSKAGVEHD